MRICPRCKLPDCVRELPPLPDGRRERKQRRSGLTAKREAITGKIIRLECSRCALGFFDWTEPVKGEK